jgi:DNA-binding protein
MFSKKINNVVIIGRKPVMNYVTACLTLFNAGAKTVTVKARGQAISHAVDTIELLRRAFIKNLDVQTININTEEMTRPGEPKTNVSTIDIMISKPSKT